MALFGTIVIAQARRSVDLGPALGAARHVQVRAVLCNGDVDRLEINPRASELKLEGVLRDHGALDANVIMERMDCPEPQP